MPIQEAAPVRWRKSTRSNNADIGCCVEVAAIGGTRAIRDSKNPGGPHLTMSVDGLSGLIAAIKGDLLDLTST